MNYMTNYKWQNNFMNNILNSASLKNDFDNHAKIKCNLYFEQFTTDE